MEGSVHAQCTLYSTQGLMLLTQIVLPETIAGSAVSAAAVIVVRCVIVIWLCADAAPASASTSASAGAAIVQ